MLSIQTGQIWIPRRWHRSGRLTGAPVCRSKPWERQLAECGILTLNQSPTQISYDEQLLGQRDSYQIPCWRRETAA
jgi:hypothetical protein